MIASIVMWGPAGCIRIMLSSVSFDHCLGELKLLQWLVIVSCSMKEERAIIINCVTLPILPGHSERSTQRSLYSSNPLGQKQPTAQISGQGLGSGYSQLRGQAVPQVLYVMPLAQVVGGAKKMRKWIILCCIFSKPACYVIIAD